MLEREMSWGQAGGEEAIFLFMWLCCQSSLQGVRDSDRNKWIFKGRPRKERLSPVFPEIKRLRQVLPSKKIEYGTSHTIHDDLNGKSASGLFLKLYAALYNMFLCASLLIIFSPYQHLLIIFYLISLFHLWRHSFSICYAGTTWKSEWVNTQIIWNDER